eukprot:6281955-Pyramimonas_sp.AAC.2
MHCKLPILYEQSVGTSDCTWETSGLEKLADLVIDAEAGDSVLGLAQSYRLAKSTRGRLTDK